MKLILAIFHIQHRQAGGTNYFIFCPNQIRTMVAMATYSCLWIIMGGNENWHLLLYLQIFWQNLYKRQNLWKNIKKSTSQKLFLGIKLKLCRIVSNNCLYKKLFLLPLLKHFGCYGNLKFPLTCNGKSENWDLLLSHCRYFDESFFRNVCWVVLYQTYTFCPNLAIWLVVMATKRLNLREKKNINSSEAIWEMKLKLCRIVHSISFYKSYFFYICYICTLVAMAT